MNNAYKFLFLGVLILVTAFARAGQFSSTESVRSDFTASFRNIQVPLLVLPPVVPDVAKLAGNAAAPAPEATDTGRLSDTAVQSGENIPVAHREKSGDPQIHAHVALVADLKTGNRFFALRPDVQWPLASLTKLMTAAVAVRSMNLDAPVTLGPVSFALNESEKSLTVGDQYKAGDLLKVMLSVSSNVAAEEIADSYGRANFIGAMNTLAGEWGLTNTNFDDPSGLSVSNQSTAGDLEKMVAKLYVLYPQIFRATTAQDISIREVISEKTLSFKNINTFAGQPDFLGGKTGYTDEAQGNLVTLWNYENRPVLVIVLGTDDRFGDTTRLLDWFRKQ